MLAERVAAKASEWANEFFSDRGALAKGTKGATALAVAPLAYATQPLAADCVVGGQSCTSGTETCCGAAGDCLTSGCTNCGCTWGYSGDNCCDGFTAFCCRLPGGSNYHCPSYAFIGGWWECGCYGGSGLCSTQNVRYYIDCNTCYQSNCPNGCQCANGNCGNRRTCCNNFRYGNCNEGTHPCTDTNGGYVVCRLMTCVPPYDIGCTNCSTNTPGGRYKNCTCHHEDPCL
jgi:hypothetical protein